MKKILSTFLAFLMVLSAFAVCVIPAAADGETQITPAEHEYTPGMVAWYRGSQNTRAGEDTNSSVWEDLISGYDLKVKTGSKVYFDQSGLVTESASHYFPSQIVDLVNGDEFTVEIRFGEFISLGKDFNTFMNSSNDNFALFRRNTNDNLEFKWAAVAGTNRPMCNDGLDLIDCGLVAVTYKVGGQVTIYVDGQQKASKPCTSKMGANDLFIGHTSTKDFRTTYKDIRFYDKCLTDQEIAYNASIDGYTGSEPEKRTDCVTVAQPVTHISGDIALAREINTSDELSAVVKAEVKPASVILYLNSELKVTNESGNVIDTLDAVLEKLDYSVIPVFVISDADIITSLSSFLKSKKFYDCAVMSKNASLVSAARQEMPSVRGIIDYTETYKDSNGLSKEECIELRKHLHTNWGTIALLPQNTARKDAVQYLYDSVVNVWVKASDTPSATEIYDAILSGAIGVISDDTAGLFSAATAVPENTVTRVPLNIGHRGLPSSYPENTVEGSLAGYESGANVIELDIYYTKDGNLAVMHDGNTGRTCNKDLSVESSTLEELQKLLVNKGYENNSKKNSFKLPSFEDYLAAFKDTDCRLFIEIKSTNEKLVPLMKEQIEKYDMYAQCAVITFHENQLANLRKYYPEMSGGFLCGSYMGESDPDKDMKSVMNLIGKTNATLNPSFAGYGEKAIRAALIRGISIYPWTFDSTSFKDYFEWGYSGLTGNNADAMGRILKTVSVSGVESGNSFAVGDTVDMTVNTATYSGSSKTYADVSWTILEGADLVTLDNGKLTFNGVGTVSLVASAEYKKSLLAYSIYTQPLTFTVAEAKAPEETTVEETTVQEETTAATADTTVADETSSGETSSDEATTEAEESKGCKSLLSGLAVLLSVVTGFGVAWKRRF